MPSSITFSVTGIAAAMNTGENTVTQVTNIDPHMYQNRRRVVMWTVARDPLLDRLQERWCRALVRQGMSVAPYLQDRDWTPHVTVGTTGPDMPHWEAYRGGKLYEGDVRGTAGVTLPTDLSVDRLHITNGETQPRSLALVWRCR